jgi:hypothetical protein
MVVDLISSSKHLDRPVSSYVCDWWGMLTQLTIIKIKMQRYQLLRHISPPLNLKTISSSDVSQLRDSTSSCPFIVNLYSTVGGILLYTCLSRMSPF